MYKKIVFGLMFSVALLLSCFRIEARSLTFINYRGETLEVKAIEKAIYRGMKSYAYNRGLNEREYQAFMDCVANYIIPKLKNGELTVYDDNHISYEGYVVYFNHKWDDRKERKKFNLKYNPHKIGQMAINLLFSVIEELWKYQL